MKFTASELKRIEKLASEIENKLGLNDAGDELIDEAERKLKEESISDEIDKRTNQEKKEVPVLESPLEAEENELQDEVANLEKGLDEADDEAVPAVQEPAEESAAEESDAEEEASNADAKSCIASIKKLIKIAHAVKMSKDIPATKKEEVLGRIQKATENLKKGAASMKKDDEESGAESKEHETVQLIKKLLDSKRGKINTILGGNGRANNRLSMFLKDYKTKSVKNMSLIEIFRMVIDILNVL